MSTKDHRSLDLALVVESDPTHLSSIEMRRCLGYDTSMDERASA